jgi:hypothetical protein
MRPFVLFFLFCLVVPVNVQSQQLTAGKSFPRRSNINDVRPLFVIFEGFAGILDKNASVIKNPTGIPRRIMGKGELNAELLASFLLEENKNADRSFTESLAALYIAEAKAEGVNHDIAFAQMCLETGFLRFGGLVVPEMNNFCGLGATGPGKTGEWFPTAEIGVRAHIQHLQAYASNQPLQGNLADPRYHFVRRGSSPSIHGLAGSWAADKLYAEKIEKILQRLYQYHRLKTAPEAPKERAAP